MNPNRNDVERLPHYGRSDVGGQESLTLSFQRPGEGYTPTDLEYFTERSTSLTEWSTEGIEFTAGTTDPLTGLQVVTYRLLTPIGSIPEEYLRLRVELR